MKRLFTYFVFLALSACASVPVEGLVTDLNLPGWKVGYQRDFGAGLGYIREFVPAGETIDDWSKLVSIEFVEGERRTPLEFIHAFHEERKKLCPATKFQVLETDRYSVTYLFNFPDCEEHEMQSELSRIYAGNDGLHRLSYAEKSEELPESTIKQWLSEFDSSYIAKGSEKTPIR